MGGELGDQRLGRSRTVIVCDHDRICKLADVLLGQMVKQTLKKVRPPVGAYTNGDMFCGGDHRKS